MKNAVEFEKSKEGNLFYEETFTNLPDDKVVQIDLWTVLEGQLISKVTTSITK